jgi:hypothetical protein
MIVPDDQETIGEKVQGEKAMDGNMSRSARFARVAQLRRGAPVDDEPPAGPPVTAARSILDVPMGADQAYDIPIAWLKAEWRRLEARQQRLWTAHQGENRVRIVPVKGQEGFYGQIPWHWGVGPKKRGVPCRGRIGAPCHPCERIEALAESPNQDDQARAAAMRVKSRFLVQIIDVDEPERGIQVWATTEAMLNKLVALLLDEDWRDLLDPQVGRTVSFTRRGEGLASRYSDPQPSPNRSPIPYPGWRDELKTLDDYLPLISYFEQQRISEGDDGLAGNAVKSRSATKAMESEDF